MAFHNIINIINNLIDIFIKTCAICRAQIAHNYDKRKEKKMSTFKLIINGGSIGTMFNDHKNTKSDIYKFWTLKRKNNQLNKYNYILTNRWNILTKKIEITQKRLILF